MAIELGVLAPTGADRRGPRLPPLRRSAANSLAAATASAAEPIALILSANRERVAPTGYRSRRQIATRASG
jgi:hypothetical protein